MIDSILEYNRKYVAEKGYERYATDKYPDKKLAVLSCMDTASRDTTHCKKKKTPQHEH